ncbi:MAG TPA: 50S ribosomal protein L29 [Phycisphaerae bacterium]|nr:50S ribosomal protein L29 [Phycisphaerae bacterium]HNU44461.1 50S ribosomal protein L29 [Phycisphaerae bacterium]
MKIGEFRDMQTDELHHELERIRRRLFDLRAQAVTEKLENPNQLTAGRRDVARILTVLRQRGELGVEEKQHHMESLAGPRKRR